jgi:fumarylacetoacetase
LSFVVPADAKSWVEVPADSHFPIQNLPFGVGCPDDKPECVCIRIGDHALHLWTLLDAGLLPEEEFPLLCSFQDMDRGHLSEVRKLAYELLRADNPILRDNEIVREHAVTKIDDALIQLPCLIGAYVDFYSGINHASNVGKMFRPDMPALLPNYRWLPVGYNGRASSVMISGEDVRRPKGQTMVANAEKPVYGPSKELDFELEMGFFTGRGNTLGEPIPIDQVADYILGFVLVNDWSARDIQRWEYQPLGPFLAKTFGTSISPWVVTLDALEPFRIAGPQQDPEPLDYLKTNQKWHFDINLEVSIQTEKMTKPQVICQTNSKELYWSFAQQLAHQTCNGTNVEPGDLYASGTISGTEPGSFGSLLELTWRGQNAITMNETGEKRTFLEDGDTVIMSGWCQGDGYRVGFGTVEGKILPAS